ncbi:hypothetical protein DPMN_163554 [Dreissena polymorpha]|uniref:Uncharacterized protein n=1 Tax=Dreissena polymorpha TaxID=45954 RepID=A0A9D4IUI9_DREPO|nr:hypothetical protein DPMN_163554 [Dreissena polymorpha]
MGLCNRGILMQVLYRCRWDFGTGGKLMQVFYRCRWDFVTGGYSCRYSTGAVRLCYRGGAILMRVLNRCRCDFLTGGILMQVLYRCR